MENEFIKLIVSSSTKKAEKENMTEEQKKDYINKKLFKHFEDNNLTLEKAIKMYKGEYDEFDEIKFKNYAIKNTNRIEILENEKTKLNDKIKKIKWEILQLDREIGRDGRTTKFDVSCIGKVSVNQRIDEVYNKYLIKVQDLEEGKELSDEQRQEYNELIKEMTENFKDVRQLHKIAKEQSKYFKGMGEDYQQIIKENSPEYAKYIDSSIKNQTKPLFKEKEELENKQSELVHLEGGLLNCIIKTYNPRIRELKNKQEEQR